ncbi:MAG: glycosyltransferase [Chloroflexi bacterium]|nr:glycosyltransferase [Chloroflexota bacterium]
MGIATILSGVCILWWTLTTRQRPDVVHGHMGLNAFTAALVARWRRVPLVTNMNGSDVNFGTEVRRGNRFRRWATILGLRSSRMVISISEDLTLKVIALGVSSLRVVHIPGGFDEAKFHPRVVHIPDGFDEAKFRQIEKNEARRSLGLPTDGKIVLSVASLSRVKGPDVLLDAFGRCRSAGGLDLYLVGDGPERDDLAAAARRVGLDGRVHFMGRRPHEEIPLWMSACDLFVMASRNEGWPSVLSEVLGCGRPVVATAVGGIPEIIKDGFLGELVEPENPEALAVAIDRNLGRSFDSEAISRYAEQFRWSAIVPRVMEVYKAVVSEA